MNRNFIDKIKQDFSFLDISDDVFEKLFKRCIDPKKSEEENKEKLYKVLYGIISDNFIETGSFIDIEKYITKEFDLSTLEKSIESLNKLTLFLTECKVDINKDNYNRILKESEQFSKCLKSIFVSKELSKEKKYELLNEKSADLLDFYNEDNYYMEEYSDVVDISEEEFEKELKDDDIISDSSVVSDATKIYLNEIGKIPLLTPEEEYRLTKLYRETHDKKIKDKIIESNLRLVVSVAKKVNSQYTSLTFLDLISAGNEGLFRALQDYDPDQARFTTYARPWIYQRIRREIQDNNANIRVPVHVQEKMKNYNDHKKVLEEKLGREPTIEEIKELTGLSYEKIYEYENNISKTISMHTKILTDERDSSELGDFIADNTDSIPEEIVIKNDKSNIDMLFNGLTDVEKMIMLLRAGLYDDYKHTLEETAIILHRLGLKDKTLTRERVRQIEKKAIRKIKKNKEKREQGLTNISIFKDKEIEKKEKPTLKDVIILLRTTEKDILYSAHHALSDRDKIVINECIGMDIAKAELKNPTKNMIDNLLESVYPKLLYEVNKRVHSKKIRETVLPKNIYKIDARCDKNDIEKQIDILQPFERLVLNKFYDIYTGELRHVTNVTLYEKEQIVIIVEKIKKGLLEIKKSSVRIDTEKNIVTKNKLFEYFGIENKELVILIIGSLEEQEIAFLKKWYGENYDEDPSTKEDYKEIDKLERNKIFNKIKVRIQKYKRLKSEGKNISMEEFCRRKYINRCSKDNIYEYFENEGYTEEEITQAISELTDKEKGLLYDYYGSDLKHPIIDNHMPEILKRKVLINIYNKVRKILIRNRNNKKLVKKLNID